MNYLTKKILFTFSLSIMMLTVTSCSTSSNHIAIKSFPVEQVSSMGGKILQADLYDTQTNGLVIRGKVKRQFYVRNAQIPGYLQVELFDLKGKVSKKINYKYGKKNGKLSKLSFNSPLPEVDITSISKARIIHHNAR